MTRLRIGQAALVGYIATVWLANYFITHVGDQPFEGGPHTIPVGFGYDAPSGVLWVGVALLLRDLVQGTLGRAWVVGGILVGAALSYTIAPSFALASGVAFLASEFADFVIFTMLVEKGYLIPGVVFSNIVGAIADTFLFLWVAFGSITFWQGQIIGKLWATVAVLPVLWWQRRRLTPLAAVA